MFAEIVMIFALTASVGQVEVDRKELVAKLQALSAAVEDFSCEYEGSMSYTAETAKTNLKLSPKGVYDEYSGRYSFRKDGAALLDIYHRFAPSNELQRQTTAVINGFATIYRRSSDSAQGSGTRSPIRGDELTAMASPVIIMARDTLLKNLQYEGFRVLRQPDELVDSHLCEVYDFVYKRGENPTLQNAPGERFWVDMRRDGHVLKHEAYAQNITHLASRLSKVNLVSVPFGKGQDAWFPTSGRSEGFSELQGDNTFVYRETPTVIESIAIMVSTIRVNQGLPDSAFAVNFKSGTPITDRLKATQYEFGQQQKRPLSRAEADAQVRDQLAQADAQKRELEAASWSRSGPDWLGWSPWAISVIACITLIVVFVRRRAAG